MKRIGLLLVGGLAAALGLAASAAPLAELPAGAQISASLEYVGRVPDSSNIVEGKFDRIGNRQVLVVTGRFGFKTYDVSDPASPQLLDTFQPPGILGANGFWQDEDMDLDTNRKLIIGSLDPRHDDVDQAACPGIGCPWGEWRWNSFTPIPRERIRIVKVLVPRTVIRTPT